LLILLLQLCRHLSVTCSVLLLLLLLLADAVVQLLTPLLLSWT
jgi:hypothetical protein